MNENSHALRCENCDAALHGAYCHRCGQSAHNPLRSFGHALEEVFESFWHLDGRVFRTLRDLLIPGRIISAYLGGHRVPYLPPLRLFVILAVLAFFVAQFAFRVSVGDASQFDRDTTVAEVVAHRDQALGELERTLQELQGTGGMHIKGIRAGQQALRAAADRRIAEIEGRAAPQAAAPEPAGQVVPFDVHGQAWDEYANPLRIDALPDFANRWLNHRIAQGQRNLASYRHDPQAFVHDLLHSVPTALFVLVPVFAVLLKLLYLRSGRGYLEHLVVALYSHAFLCLALLGLFVLQIVADRAPALAPAAGWLQLLLWLWMAVYLWWTQWRVYGQGRLKTTCKYLLLARLTHG